MKKRTWGFSNYLMAGFSLAFVVLVTLIIYRACSGESVADIMRSEKAYKILEDEKADLDKKYNTSIGVIEEKERLLKNINKEIEKRDQEIAQLKAKMQKIPRPTGPFKSLADCQVAFDLIRVEYDRCLGLNLQFNLQIENYKYQSALQDEISNDKDNALAIAGKQKENLEAGQDKLKEQVNYYKKKRAPLFAVVVGGGMSTTGKFYVGVSAGINLTAIFKRVF